MKPKFQRLHLENRKKIIEDIEELKEEIRFFKRSNDINNAFTYFSTADSIKNRLDYCDEKVREIEYE